MKPIQDLAHLPRHRWHISPRRVVVGLLALFAGLTVWGAAGAQEPPQCPLDQVSRPVSPQAAHQPGDCRLDMKPHLDGSVSGTMVCPVDGGAHGHVTWGQYGPELIDGEIKCVLDVTVEYPHASVASDVGWYEYAMAGVGTLSVQSFAAACADPSVVGYWIGSGTYAPTLLGTTVLPHDSLPNRFGCQYELETWNGNPTAPVTTSWNNRTCTIPNGCAEDERINTPYTLTGRWIVQPSGQWEPDPDSDALVTVGGEYPNVREPVPLWLLDETE